MSQDGQAIARAEIEIVGEGRVGSGRLRSIAVAADAQLVWLIAQQAGSNESMLLEVDGFDALGPFVAPAPATSVASGSPLNTDAAAHGARIFQTEFTPEAGLGPLFNASSCLACHPGPGGSSAREDHFARRVARMNAVSGRIAPIEGRSSINMPRLSTSMPGPSGTPVTAAGLPRQSNVVSLRMPPALFGVARMDEIPDAAIEAQAIAKGDGIKGRANVVTTASGTRRVGRYGWKADIATLDEMVAEAFTQEMGVNSALAVHPRAPIKDDGGLVRAVSAFLRGLVRPTTDSK
jgi:hypothetical protein